MLLLSIGATLPCLDGAALGTRMLAAVSNVCCSRATKLWLRASSAVCSSAVPPERFPLFPFGSGSLRRTSLRGTLGILPLLCSSSIPRCVATGEEHLWKSPENRLLDRTLAPFPPVGCCWLIAKLMRLRLITCRSGRLTWGRPRLSTVEVVRGEGAVR